MVKVLNKKTINRIRQGDVLKDVAFIEKANVIDGYYEISKISFPLIIVLTQDCDLEQDFNNKIDIKKETKDKYLLSIIVAPLYNYDEFLLGEHLENIIDRKMQIFGTKDNSITKSIRQNNNPRYHYFEFPPELDGLKFVIDFKHYFSVDTEYLYNISKENFVCSIDILYRELISQRFANFLSRIGLPPENDDDKSN